MLMIGKIPTLDFENNRWVAKGLVGRLGRATWEECHLYDCFAWGIKERSLYRFFQFVAAYRNWMSA